MSAPSVTGRQARASGFTDNRNRLLDIAQNSSATAVLVMGCLACALIFPGFLTAGNLASIATAACFLGLIVLGQSYVIIMGGLDLSVGSMIGLASVLAAHAVPYAWPFGLLLPVAAGAAVGLINGLLIAKARMAPFIVTLAGLLALQGLAVALAQRSIVIDAQSPFTAVANGTIIGLGHLAWILFGGFALGALILNRTSYGSALFAIGGNEQAARMLGVRVDRIKVATYTVSGSLAGLSGALLAAHLSSGLANAGTGYELQSIAAAVIGGVLLTGGVGTLTGALSGVLLLGVIQNVLNLMGSLNAYYQQLASGVFLVLAIVLQRALSSRRRS